jgi:valyl-tRNA synthetase
MLRILHPFMPFISEEIWQSIRPYLSSGGLTEHLAIAAFPRPSESDTLTPAEAESMDRCIALTQTINSLRSLAGHHPGQRVRAILRVPLEQGSNPVVEDETGKLEMLSLHPGLEYPLEIQPGFRHFEKWSEYVTVLAKLSRLEVVSDQAERTPGLLYAPLGWAEVGIEAPERFDFAKARDALTKKLEEVRTHLRRNQSRYDNPGFRAKADEATVAEIAEKIEDLAAQEKVLEGQISQLS